MTPEELNEFHRWWRLNYPGQECWIHPVTINEWHNEKQKKEPNPSQPEPGPAAITKRAIDEN